MIPSDNYFSPSAWNVMVNMANVFIKSAALPKHISNASQLLMILQTGKEMGLKPMQAINGIYILNGKVALYAHVMLSKVLEGGVKLKWIKDTPTEVEVEFSGLERAPYISKFTIAEATKAGLVKPGGAWSSYPGAMLRARAVSAGARVFCPDLISGAYTLEEIADVEVDKDGNETLKNAKNLDLKAADPNHIIRGQIKTEIIRLGQDPTSEEIFVWVEKNTDYDLREPLNFGAILEILKNMPTPGQEPPQTPPTTENPPQGSVEGQNGIESTAVIAPAEETPKLADVAINGEVVDLETKEGAAAFDRALATKASMPFINLFKSLLSQKHLVPVTDLTSQLRYLETVHNITVSALEEITHDEIKEITEKLTKEKVPETVIK